MYKCHGGYRGGDATFSHNVSSFSILILWWFSFFSLLLESVLWFLEKYVNIRCVLKELSFFSQSKINSLSLLLFSLFLLFYTKSGYVFHLSLLNASHTVYRRGNFLFRTVPASRSNLSFKSTRAHAHNQQREFPLRLSREEWSPRMLPMSGPFPLPELRARCGHRKRKTRFWSHNGTFNSRGTFRTIEYRNTFHIVNNCVLWISW